MTTFGNTLTLHDHHEHEQRYVSHQITRYAVPVGRALFALIFLAAAPRHFTAATVEYARAQGVPLAHVLVPASGALAFLGGMSIALGFKARWGALMLALFLVPVTVMMHRFWAITDPQLAMMQQVMFMKNVALLGSALILVHFGAGPISIDARIFKARSEAATGWKRAA